MTTNNEAFEKLALENEMDIESLNPDGSYANIETESAWLWFQDGLRIATTEATKRMAELESEVAELIADIETYVIVANDNAQIIIELQASNNTLREALEKIHSDTSVDSWQNKLAEQALSATPDKSLQALKEVK